LERSPGHLWALQPHSSSAARAALADGDPPYLAISYFLGLCCTYEMDIWLVVVPSAHSVHNF